MDHLEIMRNQWQGSGKHAEFTPFQENEFSTLIKKQMKKQNHIIGRYFWGTFLFHILIYALMGHVLIKYGIVSSDQLVLTLSLFGIALTFPFTAKLMIEFKKLAQVQRGSIGVSTIKSQVEIRYGILSRYFRFKKLYDYFLIPIHCAIGAVLSFHIFVPGSFSYVSFPIISVFVISLASCWYAIRSENRTYFKLPLEELKGILGDFDKK
ncbi:hypothetical protein [Arthrospiribacter ruber]|uniref:Uncharacterized protein n=1 Tax=Arthrospiribacter ruber TaxID=2487934 RepID=A0A951J580_9BACT|nr:hypothetical protein [Arthrospiribacter ruber]MBW3470251.1 hypothetical protein [Arthrospiribacter ruber]